MAHDVFISYAVEDVQVAEKVCRELEEESIKCWMAPRDVPYGADYEEAIVDAIAASPLLILILSSHSNASQHVKREIQNACAEGSPTQIIPFRIDAVAYSKALRYYLGSAQWLDASTPPLEAHLRRLVEHVRARLPATSVRETAGGKVREQRPKEEAEKEGTLKRAGAKAETEETRRRSLPLLVGGAAALLAVVALVMLFAFNRNGDSNNVNVLPTPTVEPTPQPPTPTPSVGPTASPTPDARPTSTATPAPTATPRPTRQPTPTPTTPPTPTPMPTATPTPPRPTPTGPVVIEVTSDDILAESVRRELRRYAELSDVRVRVSNGVVTLMGRVPAEKWKSRAEFLAEKAGATQPINNRLVGP
jgi:hypothetical protein